MFFDNQNELSQNNYKKMLSIMGNLSLLFSDSNCPYLSYRAHENIFCKCFNAENLARHDCSADAKKENIGIALKTWVGQDDQKIAEFGKLRENYNNLTGLDLVKKIAEYRNERIRITKNLHGINSIIYHIVKRIPNMMQIIEYSLDDIDIENISLIEERGNNNNTYFTDRRHTYHFSSSKNTLYMIFENGNTVDEFNVEIIADPYSFLLNLRHQIETVSMLTSRTQDFSNKLCLRLYTIRHGEKIVHEKSGLNQWNASGRPRDPNEIYIPYPKKDRDISEGFFPPRDTVFNLTLPNGSQLLAKVCQAQGKAIMSNPNKELGTWLLRRVFEVPERTLITYEMLERFGIDSVIFTKLDNNNYKIDFSEIGTYEEYINNLNHITEAEEN